MLHWAMWVILNQELFFDMNKTFVSFNVKNSGNKLPKYQQLVYSLLEDIDTEVYTPLEQVGANNHKS